MVLAFERGMTSPMNIIVVVVSRPINVKVANIGTVLWATVITIIGYRYLTYKHPCRMGRTGTTFDRGLSIGSRYLQVP